MYQYLKSLDQEGSSDLMQGPLGIYPNHLIVNQHTVSQQLVATRLGKTSGVIVALRSQQRCGIFIGRSNVGKFPAPAGVPIFRLAGDMTSIFCHMYSKLWFFIQQVIKPLARSAILVIQTVNLRHAERREIASSSTMVARIVFSPLLHVPPG